MCGSEVCTVFRCVNLGNYKLLSLSSLKYVRLAYILTCLYTQRRYRNITKKKGNMCKIWCKCNASNARRCVFGMTCSRSTAHPLSPAPASSLLKLLRETSYVPPCPPTTPSPLLLSHPPPPFAYFAPPPHPPTLTLLFFKRYPVFICLFFFPAMYPLFSLQILDVTS